MALNTPCIKINNSVLRMAKQLPSKDYQILWDALKQRPLTEDRQFAIDASTFSLQILPV